MNLNYTRTKLISVLKKQGFAYEDGTITINGKSKSNLRNINKTAVDYLLKKNKKFIIEHDKEFISKYIANGDEINPSLIKPKLVYFDSLDKEKNNLFNWVKLHWSIPISAGYGRRLRYLVFDEYNNKLIGIIGLADPVYALKDRDSYIGWDKKTKAKNLRCIMDGFVIGAVPPYSLILGGKLVASLIASKQVADDFNKKYKNQKSLISGRKFNGKLVAVTTSSAFGKSAMYDRIKIPNGPEFLHVGWSKGSGEFQFSNGEYKRLLEIAKITNKNIGKNSLWGSGPRNKRVVIRSALRELGMSQKLLYHGIKRELFLVPLYKNWKEILIGKNKILRPIKNNTSYISEYILKRWVVPRSNRDYRYKNFSKIEYSLSGV